MSGPLFSSLLQPKELEAIGQVAVESAWLERAVEHWLSRLLRISRKKVDALMEGRMMHGKLLLLKMVGRAALKDARLKDEFSQIIASAQEANTRRNTVIHGVWSPGSREKGINALADLLDVPPPAMARKRTSPGNYVEIRSTEVRKVAAEVNRATWQLIIFGNEHFFRYLTPKQKHQAMLAGAILSRAKTQPIRSGSPQQP